MKYIKKDFENTLATDPGASLQGYTRKKLYVEHGDVFSCMEHGDVFFWYALIYP